MKTTLTQHFALKKSFFALLVLWASWSLQAQTTRYVKPTASGSGDGTSWANASGDFQAMIQASASGDAVWVAAGTYKPTRKPFNSGVEMVTSDIQDKTFHIVMVSFTGKPTENGNQLAWQTASETQNMGFEIEKWRDERTFEKMGFVAGNSTTSVPQRYVFWDTNVAKRVTYYRLKQLNWDGTFEYSKTISVEATDKVAVRIRSTTVLDILTVDGATTYQIFNAAGQFILQSFENQLNVSQLPSGVYFLRVQSETLKFVKL